MSASAPVQRRPGIAGAFRLLATQWGEAVFVRLAAVGDFAFFVARTMRWLLARRPHRGTLLVPMHQVGVLSLPVVALTGTFIGMVLAVQSYFQFSKVGLESRLGAVINMSLVRELGPVLAATMLAGRVGGAIAAELGTMRVTEQLDAMEAMGADPLHQLVVPRFLACLLLIPSLTIMADFMGVIGGYVYCVVVLGIDKHFYLYNSAQFVGGFDLFVGVFKSLFFGAAIALISCYRGFHCEAGAEGVGRAATGSFVLSFVTILVLDFMLGILLDTVYIWIWPTGARLF